MKHVLFLAVIALASSCTTYRKCAEKYSTTYTDSVEITVPVTVLVPRDSVITRVKTDTTYIYKEVQQGRARVIIERTPVITTVQAKCDTVTITKEVPVMVPQEVRVFRDDPDKVAGWYREAFWWMLLVNLIIIALFYFLSRKSR